MAVVWVVGLTPSRADDNIRPARGLLLNYDLMFEGRSVDGGAATGLPDVSDSTFDLVDAHTERDRLTHTYTYTHTHTHTHAHTNSTNSG